MLPSRDDDAGFGAYVPFSLGMTAMNFHDLASFANASALTVLPYLGILLCVVFVHEMGHYLAGRAVGAGIHSFALGFGRELVGYTDSSGVRWKLCAIPLGGYVKFIGDADPSSKPDRAAIMAVPVAERGGLLASKSVLARALVMASGPAANFVLAAVVLSVYFFSYGRTDLVPRIGFVTPGWPAETAGIKPGDLIVGIDGWPVSTLRAVRDALQDSGGREVLVTVERDGHIRAGAIVPRLRESKGPFGREQNEVLGIEVVTGGANAVVERFGPIGAVNEGLRETWRIASMTVASVANMIEGRIPVATLSGPVKMAQITRITATNAGLRGLVGLLAVISVSVGIVNLLPIPVLDGGHLAMLAIEGLIRRPIPDQVLNVFYRVGFACIAGLVILVTANDLLSLFDSGG